MNCPNCGTQIPEGALVCPSCGTSVERTDFEHDPEHKMSQKKHTQRISDVSDLFVSPDEHQIAILGGRYLLNLINGGQMRSGFGILTNSRLYYRGKIYRIENFMLYKTYEESTVDLQDITASGFITRRNIVLEAIAVFITFIEMLLIILGAIASKDNAIRFWLITLIVGGITAALWALFILLRRTVYRISHAGGMILIKAPAKRMNELRDFDRKLHQAKDAKVRELLERE